MRLASRHLLFASLTLGLAGTGLLASQDPPPKKPPVPQDSAKFVGARVCRNCHRLPEKGDQYHHWGQKTPHVNAFKTLGTEKAREVARERGIEDPQKAPECLRCHLTAYGKPTEDFERTFERVRTWGVQCESCHGPGSAHRTLRTRAAARQSPQEARRLTTLDIPPGEIRIPDEATCRSCHNPESPTYKPYDHKTFLARVAHPNPMRRKKKQEGGEEHEPEGDAGGSGTGIR